MLCMPFCRALNTDVVSDLILHHLGEMSDVRLSVAKRKKTNKRIMTCCSMCQWGGIVKHFFSTHFTVGFRLIAAASYSLFFISSIFLVSSIRGAYSVCRVLD